MDSISNRINELVNYFSGGNVSKFAIKSGVSEANVRNYINGTQPKSEFFSKVIEVFEINSDWLLTGKGEMLKDSGETPKSTKDDLPEEYKKEIVYLKTIIDSLQKVIRLYEMQNDFNKQQILDIEREKNDLIERSKPKI